MRLITALCLILATPVAAEKISLNEISSYFNAMTTAEAQFSQVHGYGGNLYGAVVHSAAWTHSF